MDQIRHKPILSFNSQNNKLLPPSTLTRAQHCFSGMVSILEIKKAEVQLCHVKSEHKDKCSSP